MAPPTTITLENVAMAPRGPVTFHLPHDVYCAAAGDCRCTRAPGVREDYHEEKGKRVTSAENKRFPQAISLTAKGTPGAKVSGLHPSAKECPEVAALLKSRQIRVVVDKVEVGPEPEPAADKPGLTSKKASPRKPDASPVAPTPAAPPT